MGGDRSEPASTEPRPLGQIPWDNVGVPWIWIIVDYRSSKNRIRSINYNRYDTISKHQHQGVLKLSGERLCCVDRCVKGCCVVSERERERAVEVVVFQLELRAVDHHNKKKTVFFSVICVTI